jgi:3-methyladenine DNA glycosylase AlkC
MSDYDKLQERVHKAIKLAERYGAIREEHHQHWIIDQMIRKLLGKGSYQLWVERYNRESAVAGYEPWDCGIAP